MLRLRLHETPGSETDPDREIFFARIPIIAAAVVGRGSYPGSSIQYPAFIPVRERIGFDHDYEYESEEATHLRIMMRQFVP